MQSVVSEKWAGLSVRWLGADSRPAWRVETLLLALSAYFVLVCNGPFWRAALSAQSSVLFALAVALALIAVHFVAFGLVCNRWTAKPVLAGLVLASSAASYFMQRYQVYFDTSMMRNVLRTDWHEARDLITPGLFLHVLVYSALPLLLLWRVQLRRIALPRAVMIRMGYLLLALVVGVSGTLLVYKEFSALMRNQKSLRHLITPGNLVVASIKVLAKSGSSRGPRLPVGQDARLGPSWQQGRKPLLLVLVVGETVRAANWGLNGYGRQTTPELAARQVINFPDVTSCGTNTEVSVPCLFSPWGRHQYDDDRIRGSESLLHVLKRAGLSVLWRDNQSGCKGVCSDLPLEQFGPATADPLCSPEGCLDEILLHRLDAKLRETPGSLVLVLHQMGNHGPAYFKRYPLAQRAFAPTCDTAELGACSQAQIVNSYDNAIRYTDHFLARTVDMLQQQTSHDAAMIYISDHGESLGEGGVFLHGLPRAIAPEVQTHVPMVMWMTPGFAQPLGLRTDCLRQRASQPASHDNVFHTVLGLLDVRTSVYQPDYDLSAGCRN
ncbi:phosphoethanolamine transferase [Chitinimonas sp. BJYL2]|uniref:phosphoethanolamine transferase n=1 Tax=Chitinimonas sp. BJYL2 TaxID=2976696 RepID=UPI0022B2ADAD|nr:phosphoethanolamine--lipid A transferase [Chitinimonas sp. BJYL2]